jgi:NAD(P)-dependent dehydrogenase (short-subunit alcohol dehydrogenase family)
MTNDHKRRIIITGSRGLIGTSVCDFLKKNSNVLELDLQLGHDLSNEDFVKQWFKDNHADYLINLFGLNDHVDKIRNLNSLFDITLESFNAYLYANLTTLFSVCREFARNNTSGSIINMSSIYGIVSPIPSLYKGKEKHIGYSVSKCGVIMLTKHLAVHLAPSIRVNCIALGGVENSQPTDFKEAYEASVPMGRMLKKEEIIGLFDYLCSEKSLYMTGSVLSLDGGWTSI